MVADHWCDGTAEIAARLCDDCSLRKSPEQRLRESPPSCVHIGHRSDHYMTCILWRGLSPATDIPHQLLGCHGEVWTTTSTASSTATAGRSAPSGCLSGAAPTRSPFDPNLSWLLLAGVTGGRAPLRRRGDRPGRRPARCPPAPPSILRSGVRVFGDNHCEAGACLGGRSGRVSAPFASPVGTDDHGERPVFADKGD